jgi:carbamoyl-phosphate synthase large subunit
MFSAVLNKEKPEGLLFSSEVKRLSDCAKGCQPEDFQILGTTVEETDRAEERGIFDNVLQELGAKRPSEVVFPL